MELLEAILAALKSQSGGNILTAAGIYIASPLCVSLYVQYLKRSRKRAGRPVGPWMLRGVASVGTFVIAAWIGWRLGKWPLADAVDHALAIALMYPLAVTVYLNWLERNRPDLAEDLGYDTGIGAPTELRATGNGDDTRPPQ